MYTSFFGLNEKPFAITPDPRYLYMSERHAEALAHLLYGINEAGGFVQLTGEVGTGKTTIVRSLLGQIPQNAEIALILNPRITPAEFLLTICEELHVSVPEYGRNSVKELVDALNGMGKAPPTPIAAGTAAAIAEQWRGAARGLQQVVTFSIAEHVTAGVLINGKPWLDQAGYPASDALSITERFRRRDFGHMDMEMVIDDRKMYTKPWSIFGEFILQADTELIEFICEENEKDSALLGK